MILLLFALGGVSFKYGSSAEDGHENQTTRKHTRPRAGTILGRVGVLAGRFSYGLSATVRPGVPSLLRSTPNKRDNPGWVPSSNPRSGGNQRGRSKPNLRRPLWARWSFPASLRTQGRRAKAVNHRSWGQPSRRRNSGQNHLTVKSRNAPTTEGRAEI